MGMSRNIIPIDFDSYLGYSYAPSMEADMGGVSNDSAMISRVQSIGKKLAPTTDNPKIYTFKVLNTDTINAFALPGGPVYVNKGLLNLINDNELAAVMGHELGHINARHSIESMERNFGLGIVSNLVTSYLHKSKKLDLSDKDLENINKFNSAMSNFIQLGYSRDNEYESDAKGLNYAVAAGYNPYGMLTLMKKFQSMQTREPSKFEIFFSTHPATGDRIDKIEDIIKKNYPNAVLVAPAPVPAPIFNGEKRLTTDSQKKTVKYVLFGVLGVGALTSAYYLYKWWEKRKLMKLVSKRLKEYDAKMNPDIPTFRSAEEARAYGHSIKGDASKINDLQSTRQSIINEISKIQKTADPDFERWNQLAAQSNETRLVELRSQLADYENRKRLFAPDRGLGIDNTSSYNRLIQDTKEELKKVEDKVKMRNPAIEEAIAKGLSAQAFAESLGVKVIEKNRQDSAIANMSDGTVQIWIPKRTSKNKVRIEEDLWHEIGHYLDDAHHVGGYSNLKTFGSYGKYSSNNKAVKDFKNYIIKNRALDYIYRVRRPEGKIDFRSIEEIKASNFSEEEKKKFIAGYMEGLDRISRYLSQDIELFAAGFAQFMSAPGKMKSEASALYDMYSKVMEGRLPNPLCKNPGHPIDYSAMTTAELKHIRDNTMDFEQLEDVEKELIKRGKIKSTSMGNISSMFGKAVVKNPIHPINIEIIPDREPEKYAARVASIYNELRKASPEFASTPELTLTRDKKLLWSAGGVEYNLEPGIFGFLGPIIADMKAGAVLRLTADGDIKVIGHADLFTAPVESPKEKIEIPPEIARAMALTGIKVKAISPKTWAGQALIPKGYKFTVSKPDGSSEDLKTIDEVKTEIFDDLKAVVGEKKAREILYAKVDSAVIKNDISRLLNTSYNIVDDKAIAKAKELFAQLPIIDMQYRDWSKMIRRAEKDMQEAKAKGYKSLNEQVHKEFPEFKAVKLPSAPPKREKVGEHKPYSIKVGDNKYDVYVWSPSLKKSVVYKAVTKEQADKLIDKFFKPLEETPEIAKTIKHPEHLKTGLTLKPIPKPLLKYAEAWRAGILKPTSSGWKLPGLTLKPALANQLGTREEWAERVKRYLKVS